MAVCWTILPKVWKRCTRT